jgi:heme o synthase
MRGDKRREDNVDGVPFHPWPHRLAWMLAIAVFPLIWMGGTVTTYDAGMAVPDWPTTYSSWFYPVHLWLAVWDVFLEHGHRLLAQLVGIIAILLAVVIWRTDDRKWMRWVAAAIVVGVVAQGTLGGIRVWAGAQQGFWAWANDRLLARIHGCIAPLYFGLCAAVVAWTSRQWRWQESCATACSQAVPAEQTLGQSDSRRLPRLAWLVTAAIYLEIFLGALLRRPSAGLGIVGDAKLCDWLQSLLLGQVATWFELCVWLKVLNAGLIAIGSAWLIVAVLRQTGPLALWERVRVRAACEETAKPSPPAPLPMGEGRSPLAGCAKWFAAIISTQVLLAAATWVANYGWPAWFTRGVWTLESSVMAQGRLLVLVTTAHAAIGSLTLVAALSLTLWLTRVLPSSACGRQAGGDGAGEAVALPSPFGRGAGSEGIVETPRNVAALSAQHPHTSPLPVGERTFFLLDYWHLMRPRIVVLVLLAMAVSAWMTAPGQLSWIGLGHALLGTAMVIVGAVALNQRLESTGDAKMPRTADRPLPAGRLNRRQVTAFGLAATAIGLAYLMIASGPMLTLLATIGWLIYVGVYTPMKSRTPWQTPVGAAAGAMPVLLGAAAGGQLFNPWALILFGIVFFWQFPHSMAIAWRYRRQFAAAGVRVATVTDPTGQTAGLLAIFGATALLIVSAIPLQLAIAGPMYDVAILILGTIYLAASAWFAYCRDDRSAQWLLIASFVYLPATLAAILGSTPP